MGYSFTDHLHNFAVWTAARATQRGFTTTLNIQAAINQTDLKNLINNDGFVTSQQFDDFHIKNAEKIIDCLKNKGVSASYGQAAKIIAIYIKTSKVIRDSGLSNLSKIAHPPIDHILLENLNKKFSSLRLSGIKWTQLNRDQYFELINKLRKLDYKNFWELEQYWTPVQKESKHLCDY
jgi:hypothetical protein